MHVVITGASRGIGAALAVHYRSQGQDVTAATRDVAGDVVLDVTKSGDHAALASELKGRPVDLLVCNAGVYLDKGQALDTGYPVDMWASSFAANVTGVFQTVQHMLPLLRASKKPKIAVISSQMASVTRAPSGSYIYRASKAAALNLGRNLAADLRGEWIAVGIYHPGWVQTDMGGSSADITVDQAAAGLINRFEVLSVETTGCFETWDGQAHPY